MMTNPIIRREAINTFRSWRAVLLQVATPLVLGTLIGLRWPSDARVDVDGQAAKDVLRVFGYGLMACVMLVAPVYAATSIVKERIRGTLALLLNSPMKPWSIFLGKLVGVSSFGVVIIVLSVPAAAACFAMGGVSVTAFASMYLLLLLMIIQYASLGLLISGRAGSPESAIRLTYGAILLMAVITLVPYRLLGGSVTTAGFVTDLTDWLRCISPIPAMMDLLGDQSLGPQGLVAATSSFARYSVTASLTSIVFIMLAILRLNTHMLDRSRAVAVVRKPPSRAREVIRKAMYLWVFDPARRSGLIGPWTNPVMVKEQRCRKFGRGNWMTRLVAACLLVSLLLMLVAATSSTSAGVPTMGGIMILLQVSLIVLLTPSLAAGLISGERESGGWQLLQMTPMSSFTIVAGKLLSVVITLSLVLLATLPAYAVLIYIDPGQWQIASQVLISLALVSVFSLLLSASVSSLCTNTAAATTITYVILLLTCGGTILFRIAEGSPFSHGLVERILVVNPVAAALTLIEAPAFKEYDLLPGNWIIMAALCLLCFAVLNIQVWRLTRSR